MQKSASMMAKNARTMEKAQNKIASGVPLDSDQNFAGGQKKWTRPVMMFNKFR